MQAYISSKQAEESPEATQLRWNQQAAAYLEKIEKASTSSMQKVTTEKLPDGFNLVLQSTK